MSVKIMQCWALIFCAPDQEATAQPVFCRCRDSFDQGRLQLKGMEKVAAAARMADQFKRKSAFRFWPKELRPANTNAATRNTGSSTACQMVAALSREAVV